MNSDLANRIVQRIEGVTFDFPFADDREAAVQVVQEELDADRAKRGPSRDAALPAVVSPAGA